MKVFFLNTGIQRVELVEKDKKIPGTNISIPLSIKKGVIILNYDAKFGIKEGIKVKKIAEHEYELTIPKYQVTRNRVVEKVLKNNIRYLLQAENC